jgi:hypothetical protein
LDSFRVLSFTCGSAENAMVDQRMKWFGGDVAATIYLSRVDALHLGRWRPGSREKLQVTV